MRFLASLPHFLPETPVEVVRDYLLEKGFPEQVTETLRQDQWFGDFVVTMEGMICKVGPETASYDKEWERRFWKREETILYRKQMAELRN